MPVFPDGSEFWAGVPRVSQSARLRAWFLRRVAAIISAKYEGVPDGIVVDATRWFLMFEDLDHFIGFVSSENYEVGAANGHWLVFEDRVAKAIPDALAWASGRQPQDIEDVLAHLAQHPNGGPTEDRARDLVADPARFNERRLRLERSWPCTCRTCGEEFRPWRRGEKGRWNKTVCQPCKDGSHLQTEAEP